MTEFMSGLKRTHYCGTLRQEHVGTEVVVCGWVQRQRDLGQLTFVNLRDRTDLLQLAFGDTTDRQVFRKAAGVRTEYVLAVRGVVRERSAKNPELSTGDAEIEVQELRVLTEAGTPPFEIVERSNVREELRLRYRYLGLRRPDMQDKIIQRHKIVKIARDYFDDNGFLEIETPTLIKSTPEGACDYLVPSRVSPGNFFALPQSPQQYKQLLILSGFDRYMQVARCFRDKDLRADRQPEFTQTDLEMSFIEPEDVMAIGESFTRDVYERLRNVDIPMPFRRITWHGVMECFGFDEPDLRFGLELVNLSDALKDTEFRAFADALSVGGSVRGINLKNKADELSRKEIDKLTEILKAYDAQGLAWTHLTLNNESSNYEKFLSEQEAAAVRTALGTETGDVLLLVASPKNSVVFTPLGALRCELAKHFGLIDDSKPYLLWVTDFPLSEHDEEENRYVAMHHPFIAPREEDLDKLTSDPGSVCAKAYDMVLNGNEISGGSIRINTPEVQRQMFQVLDFTPEQAQQCFGLLIDASHYDALLHGGMAFRPDRLVMLTLDHDSIRDVIAFPKVANPSELMSSASDVVDPKQLAELGLSVVPQAEQNN